MSDMMGSMHAGVRGRGRAIGRPHRALPHARRATQLDRMPTPWDGDHIGGATRERRVLPGRRGPGRSSSYK